MVAWVVLLLVGLGVVPAGVLSGLGVVVVVVGLGVVDGGP